MDLPQLPAPQDDPRHLAAEAMALAAEQPDAAMAGLGEAARRWVQRREPRQAALALHRRAALAVRLRQSPIPDLAGAARLLEGWPDERALVLLDLGQALAQAGEPPRALLALRESERLARRSQNAELLVAARYALGSLAADVGDFASARAFLRETGAAMVHEVEGELLATLRDLGNLPTSPRADAERARRQQAVEDELAALKRELGV